jgi:hypothetical protein
MCGPLQDKLGQFYRAVDMNIVGRVWKPFDLGTGNPGTGGLVLLQK